ncbi:hypothetical protein LSAT2_007099, partial [Lamellibrachia satsuma]
MHNVHTRACSCMYAARRLRELGLAGDKRQAADQQVTMLLETAMARQLVDEPLVIVVDNIGHLYNANDCEQQFNNEVLLVTDYTQLVDTHTQTNDLPHVDTATDEAQVRLECGTFGMKSEITLDDCHSLRRLYKEKHVNRCFRLFRREMCQATRWEMRRATGQKMC